jgi:hypothetical protein
MSADDLTPLEARVAAVAQLLLDRMPPELRAECETLAALDPTTAGMRVHLDQPPGMVAFVWCDRWLGSVSQAWLVAGDDLDTGEGSTG